MKTISRYIMTLALLITAVSGAWAQTQWESGSCTVTLNNGTLTVSGNGAMADYEISSNRPWDNNRNDITSVVVESGVTTVGELAFYNFENMTSVTLPEGLTNIGHKTFRACGKLTSVTIPSTVTSIGRDAFFNCNAVTDVNLYADPANLTWDEGDYDDFKKDGSTKCHVLAEHLSAYQTKFNGQVNVIFVGDLKPLATPIEVTTNAASEQDLFTTASFEMPASDVTVDYELVRDMSYKVAFSGVPTRARLAKDDNGKFHFADGLPFQLLDNIDAANPKDITSAEGITFMVGEMVPFEMEGNTYYQLDKETLVPLADFLADAHLGNYVICAVASTGEYDGSFSSGRIELFQGYEVEVPAKEFITYYKDEPLRVEDEAAELYTISSVNDTQAVLSQKSDAMPSNTPMLVYNNSDVTKVILLIPCNEPDMAITVAPEFQGTLTGGEIPASSAVTDYYALNGKAFVWVKDAITVGANKCWLQIGNQPASTRANTRSIVGGGNTTGIDAIENVTIDNEGWYDLQGRKLQSAPNRKGIYIHNGRKVVVH